MNPALLLACEEAEVMGMVLDRLEVLIGTLLFSL